jgi:hypothetical protein
MAYAKAVTYITTAYDRMNVPRCWGAGSTPIESARECHKIIVEYIRRRPDTQPLVGWRTELSTQDE